MGRSQQFQVRNGRFQFVCSECRAKRHMPVPSDNRRRSVRCHKCGSLQRCLLNRRSHVRQSQSGKVTMMLQSGREINADLRDISPRGLGCDVHPREARLLRSRQEVSFKCSWNPHLVDGKRYIIKAVWGNRVGLLNKTPNLIG